MKSTTLVLAIAAASLSFSALSFAQGNDRRGGRDEQPQFQQQDPRQMDQRDQPRFEHRFDPRDARRDDRYVGHRNDPRFDDRRDPRYGYRDGYRDGYRGERHFYYNARGPEFRRGGYVPREFRERQYYVTDYRAHRLSPPPRGQQWVQVGSDYVLIAIATGLIAHMVLSH
jgi:Ni/Co efflux regulator RcnB